MPYIVLASQHQTVLRYKTQFRIAIAPVAGDGKKNKKIWKDSFHLIIDFYALVFIDESDGEQHQGSGDFFLQIDYLVGVNTEAEI